MAEDQSIDTFHDWIVTRTTESLSKFRESIKAIYGADVDGAPVHLGSGVLLELRGYKCLLTAAHIIDDNKIMSLYIGGSTLVLIEGESMSSKPPNGNREDDHFDFAVLKLSKSVIASVGKDSFIQVDDMIVEMHAPFGHAYQCLGFPNSKNSRIDWQRNKVKSRIASYTGHTFEPTELCKNLSITRNSHIIMEYKKFAKDFESTRVKSMKLNGFSGGAVIDLGVPRNADQVPPRLAGLFIEYHQDYNAIVAPRLGVILRNLEKEFS